jgi:spore coat protein A, manganese oxidase
MPIDSFLPRKDAITRRQFLERAVAAAPALALPACSGWGQTDLESSPDLKLSRWVDPLPMLKKLAPEGRSAKQTLYRVQMREFEKKLHSELPATRLWGYEGQYPGPAIDTERGEPIEIRWENRLPERHLFAIDKRIHGAMAPAPEVRTVPHLHGARSPSSSDGLPENWFTPGKAVHYRYPNTQPATMLWYHDHALGITRLNVYAGLSGLFFIRDEDERQMGLPEGEYEIALVLQDRTIDGDGQLVYAPSFEDGTEPPPGNWAPEFFGRLPVVNGAIYPFLEVEPRLYRMRMLNASNARFFNLYFNLAEKPTDVPNLIPFLEIGSDGGLLPAPALLKSLLLGPAERADLLVDFSPWKDRTITLSNNAASPFPGWEFSRVKHHPLNELLQIRVTRAQSGAKAAGQPGGMPPFAGLDRSASLRMRDFVLTEAMDTSGHSLGLRINGKGYDEPITERVELGTTETWRFINATDDAHPMHLHLVQFQVLERQGYDAAAFLKGTVKLVGEVRPAPANEKGWKDTAVVYPREVLSILVRFDGFTGRYVFHCHMLEHEDNDMMRPYEVVPKKAS